MNYSRIDYAIHVLKTAPKPHKFDMRFWMQLSREEKKKYYDGDHVALNGCGTAGCAIGWIASDPLVQRDGLKLFVEDDSRIGACPRYLGESDFAAAQEYFEIRAITTEMLFDPLWYPDRHLRNPKYVIERMELLLATGEELFNEMMTTIEGEL